MAGMLTLAWAVDQSRRVLRRNRRRVHPEADAASRGSESSMWSPRGSSAEGSDADGGAHRHGRRRRQRGPDAADESCGCLGVLLRLMGFGRGGSKLAAAAVAAKAMAPTAVSRGSPSRKLSTAAAASAGVGRTPPRRPPQGSNSSPVKSRNGLAASTPRKESRGGSASGGSTGSPLRPPRSARTDVASLSGISMHTAQDTGGAASLTQSRAGRMTSAGNAERRVGKRSAGGERRTDRDRDGSSASKQPSMA